MFGCTRGSSAFAYVKGGQRQCMQSSGYRTCTQGMKDSSQLDENADMVSLMNGLSSVSFKACSYLIEAQA